MSEPFFNRSSTAWDRPEKLFFFVVAAFVLGCLFYPFVLVKRPPPEPDYWEGEDERFFDCDPTLRWDGHEYRPVDSWHENHSHRSILGPEDLHHDEHGYHVNWTDDDGSSCKLTFGPR